MPEFKNYVAVRSSDGKVFALTATDSEEAYRVFAEMVEGIVPEEGFDTGNVDIDLYDLPAVGHWAAVELKPAARDSKK